ncbi:hypothetical protein [Clostridium sp.]|uniref:hypothetical protein n=1 Tax=Clostridium sp. TaxID=1506 RepID=UPI003F3A4613
MKKDKTIGFLVTKSDKDKIDGLCAYYKMSRSELFTMLVNNHRELLRDEYKLYNSRM